MPKMITIAGEQFEVRQPYAAGQPMDEAIAKSCNQTHAENVRNNTAKAVKKLLDEGKKTEAVKLVTDYDADYSFSTPGTRVVRDPVEKEARALAKTAILADQAKKGKKAKDIDPAKLEAAIDQVSQNPEIQRLAKTRVAQKQKLGAALLEGVSLEGEASAAA